MLKNTLLLFLCWSIFSLSYAQDSSSKFGQITGVVLQKNTNEPIPSATIVVIETKKGTVTNTEGKFQLANLEAGDYTLEFSAIGFKSLQQNITVKAGEIITVDFQCQENPLELQEVTVTAQKREELLQKAPLAVASISTKRIEELQISSTNEVGRVTSNFKTYNDGSGIYTMVASRGIYTNDDTPTVGVYVDDVPLFNTMSFPNLLSDVKRIEILKGPQGTLYGRNTLAGVINIITNTPRNITEGFVELGYGNLNQLNVNAGVSIPLITNKLYAKIGGSYLSRDGYITNTFLDIDDVLSTETVRGNLKLTYYPNEKWEFMLMTGLEKRQMTATGYVGGMGTNIRILDSLKANHPYEVNYNTQGTYDVFLSNNAFKIGYYTDKISIKSITSLQYTDLDVAGEDFDFSPADGLRVVHNDRDFYTWTEELRISSAQKNTSFNWLGGLFFYHFDRETNEDMHYGLESGFPLDVVPHRAVNFSEITQTGASLFFNTDYAFTPEFKITGGLRYEIESNKTAVNRYYIKDGSKTYANADMGLVPDYFEETATYDALSPKIGLIYDKNQFLAYANVARSYRPGGINPFSLNNKEAIFDPEYSWNYEAGLKSMLWNNRLKANFTAFYIDYQDQQIYTILNPTTWAFGRDNLGRSISYGVELDTEWMLAKGLRANFNIGYLETEIKEFEITDAMTGEMMSNEGNTQAYSPQWNGNIGLNYQKTFDQVSIQLSADYQLQTEMYFDPENALKQDGYGLLNSQISVSYKDLSLAFWAKNLLDETYYSFGYAFVGGAFLNYGMPQTFGTILKYKF